MKFDVGVKAFAPSGVNWTTFKVQWKILQNLLLHVVYRPRSIFDAVLSLILPCPFSYSLLLFQLFLQARLQTGRFKGAPVPPGGNVDGDPGILQT